MDGSGITLVSGFMLGLASTLHCAGMCGGIATGLVVMFAPESETARLRVLMLAQAGRITGYMIAGGILGFAGAGIYGAFDQQALYRFLQWAAAVVLVWIGLTMAGLLPMPSAVDRVVALVSGRIARVLAPLRRSSAGPYVAGLTWGVIPCPMVYGALFTALLTGSALGGMAMMAAFGLGTLPGVTLTALGLSKLARCDGNRALRAGLGLAIAAFGLLTVIPGSPINGVLCVTPPPR